jgi:hypothetical protein
MKTIENFIEENRTEIDRLINGCIYRHDGKGGRGTVPSPPPERDDDERRDWIVNDEGLYGWAKSEGVSLDDNEDDE